MDEYKDYLEWIVGGLSALMLGFFKVGHIVGKRFLGDKDEFLDTLKEINKKVTDLLISNGKYQVKIDDLERRVDKL